MQELGDNTIRRVDWQQVCPAVLLPRAFKFALGFRVLLFAFIGLVLSVSLTNVVLIYSKPAKTSDKMLLPQSIVTHDHAQNPWQNQMAYSSGGQNNMFDVLPWDEQDALDTWSRCDISFKRTTFSNTTIRFFSEKNVSPWQLYIASCRQLFVPSRLSCLNTIIWFAGMLVIWSIIGGLITRIAAVRFAVNYIESWEHLIRFIRTRFLSFIAVVLLPLVGIFCALLPVWGLTWLFNVCFGSISDANAICSLMLLVVTFPFALIAALLAFGFALGWPLMFASISTEGTDCFDALSRAFSYVYQRPVQFVFYHACNFMLYAIGSVAVYFVFDKTVNAIGFDAIGLEIIVDSFAFGYFWVSSTVIYFLMRRSCDATPLDEVFRFSNTATKRSLPPIVTREDGTVSLQTAPSNESPQ